MRSRCGRRFRPCNSPDGGQTWNFEATPSGAQTNVDRESMWTDHSPASPYKDQIYLIWHTGVPAFVARRTAGSGGAWQAPKQISGIEQTGNAIGCDIKTNSAGDVFAFYPDADGSGKLRLAKSTDGGANFQSPRKDGTGFVQIASLFATTALEVLSPYAGSGQAVLDCLPRVRRRLSTVSSMRWAVWMRRSRMASA